MGLYSGKTTERERIINLIEEARDKCACYREVGMPICRHQLSVDEQIALIKGESSDNSIVRTSSDSPVNDTEGENK